MSTFFLISGYCIFFLAALLQGLSGFGFSILAVPLITFLISPKTSIPILILYSIIINIVVTYSTKDSIELKKIWPMLLSALIAVPLGAKLLIILPENILRIFIGIFILVFGFLFMKGISIKIRHEKAAMVPIGIISGILSGSISAGGPPVILFFANQNTERHSFRGNLAIYFFIMNLFTVPIFFLNGLITKEVINHSLTFLPALLLGVVLGNLLSGMINDGFFRKITLYLLLIMGIVSILSVIF